MGGGRGAMEKKSTEEEWDNEQQQQQQVEAEEVMITGLKGRPPRNGNGNNNNNNKGGLGQALLLGYESYDDDVDEQQQQQQQQDAPPNYYYKNDDDKKKKMGGAEEEEEAAAATAAAVQQVLGSNQFDEAVATVAESIAEAASTLLMTTASSTNSTTTAAGGSGVGGGIGASLEESEKNSSSSSSVYLDKDQGTWKCRHCIWTYRLEGPGIDLIQNPKVHSHQPMNIKLFTQPGTFFGLESTEEILANEDFNVNVKNSDIPKSSTNGISNQSYEIIQKKQTGLHLLLAEKPSVNGNTSFNFDHKDEHSEITTEIKPEVAEWDIERVIAEQDTHDLFCPNCKSCITKRVILRKRKRNDKNIEYGTKPKKTELPVSGSGVDPYTHEIDDQGTIDSGSEVTRHAVGTNDQEHDTGPDVFRCLSCFSFFIPTVSGFKLFRIFGAKDKGGKLQSPQQTPDANTRTREQGDNATESVEEDEVQALNRKQYPSDQKDDQVSLKPGASLPNSAPSQSEATANSATQKSMETGKDFVLSPNQGPILVGGAIVAEEERPDGVNETKNADVKKNSISSVATAFLFLGKSHVNGGQVEVSIGGNMKDEKNVVVTSVQGVPPLLGSQTDTKDKHDGAVIKVDKGDDLIILVKDDTVGAVASHSLHDSMVSAVPEISPVNVTEHVTEISPVSVTEHYANQPRVDESRRSNEWDILKSIVYGGLIEAITSLGVVSSAAGGNATTMNILALALANLISGLIIVVHGIRELKYEQYGVITDREEDKGDRYLEVLGWRKNYWRHAIVAVLSYLVVGLLPPLVYAFSFYKSNNKEYTMISVAAVSLIAILLLAIGKAHVQKSPRAYSKTILYYLSIGVTAAGLSFLAGQLIIKFLEKVDWFEPSGAAPVPPSSFIETISGKPAAWASY